MKERKEERKKKERRKERKKKKKRWKKGRKKERKKSLISARNLTTICRLCIPLVIRYTEYDVHAAQSPILHYNLELYFQTTASMNTFHNWHCFTTWQECDINRMAFLVFQWTVSSVFTSPVPCSVLKQKSTDGTSTPYGPVCGSVF
jgi:hypothetical protein